MRRSLASALSATGPLSLASKQVGAERGPAIADSARWPTTPDCYGQISVSFNSGDHTTVTAFAGF
ncbi:hypothetical protein [Streptomyces sp. NBC_01794]|uniref:hypothetical protein n=1 Tax=Streptomyces sp. NBC_01794 TaxID=2975942 RepID=UPI00308EEFAD|nr:hypothetical protein OIE54_00730 [Streptomyces sp. NBC_01794]